MPDRSVLVTGASSGIGQAIALRLARASWRVFAGTRRAEDGERLRQAAGTGVEPVMIDVADEASVGAAAAILAVALGERGLTAVVNNAGIAVGGPVEFLALGEWRRQFEVNVIGQISVTKSMLPLLRREPGARVVFIGSMGGRVSGPLLAPYTASKHALEAVAESLRHELRPAGIKVALVEPGAVKTPIWDKADETADNLVASMPEAASQTYAHEIASVRRSIEHANRTGVPAERVAEVVEQALTVARPRARYLVGRDAQVMGVVTRVFPDSWRDALVARGSG